MLLVRFLLAGLKLKGWRAWGLSNLFGLRGRNVGKKKGLDVKTPRPFSISNLVVKSDLVAGVAAIDNQFRTGHIFGFVTG